jgi:putative hemolysin
VQVATNFLPFIGYDTQIVATPRTRVEDSRYVVRFANSHEEIEAALKLRFEVFNLELGEGLDVSFLTGRDRDRFDATSQHLIVIEKVTDRVIGTYRVRTLEMARAVDGFYSAGEFELNQLPFDVLSESVELGRACIAQAHRGHQVLFLLWKALARYTVDEGKRFLFGCCSLTSQDPDEGIQLLRQLSTDGHIHSTVRINPKPGLECTTNNSHGPCKVELPRLFRTYLSIGAKVCGPPAIDREFKTIDFFVIFDLLQMNDKTRRLLFGK